MTRPETVLQILSQEYKFETISPTLGVGTLKELAVDIKVTAVSDSWALVIERLGADGNWYTVFQPSAVVAPVTISESIGAGLHTTVSFAHNIRFRMTPSTTESSITLSVSILGK